MNITTLCRKQGLFKEDVLNYTAGFVFKNLEKRHIPKYNYWLKDEEWKAWIWDGRMFPLPSI